MLRNMFLGDPPGNHDRILDFSTAVTGGLFFVPAADFLEDPPEPGLTSTGTITVTLGEPLSADGSLGIGSLRRSGTS
jgi:putative iron-dependent peroxidase